MMDDDDNEFVNNHCFTSESYFCEYKGRDVSTFKDKVVFADEYTMTPNRFITKSYHAFTKHGIQVFMAGDINQAMWGWGGRLFEAGRLLTFSAFRMGAYSRWALIRGWALIRINTV